MTWQKIMKSSQHVGLIYISIICVSYIDRCQIVFEKIALKSLKWGCQKWLPQTFWHAFRTACRLLACIPYGMQSNSFSISQLDLVVKPSTFKALPVLYFNTFPDISVMIPLFLFKTSLFPSQINTL